MHWERLFEPHILERGYACFQKGAVTEIDIDKDEIEASVEGSEEYLVTIELKNGQVSDLDCTCPYAMGGNHCKHMAAVLFAYENGGKGKRNKAMTYEQLKTIIDNAERDTVCRFLTDFLWNKEQYRLQFLSLVQPENEKDLVAAAKERLDDLADDAAGYDGFVDYHTASGLIDDISEWMDDEIDPLLERRQDHSAFRLSIHVMETLNSIEMDDSDGGMTEIATRCEGVWTAILDHGDPKMEQEMFSFFLNHIDGQMVDYLEEYYEDILNARFDKPDFLQRKLSCYRAKLETVNLAAADWSSKYRAEHCIRQIYALMVRLSVPDDELAAFSRQYWSFPCIRKAYMEECVKKQQWNELIRVLKESIILDLKDAPGYVRDYYLMLKDAYAKAGQTEEYRNELWFIATRIMPGDVEIFREYRQQFSSDQWPGKREEIFAAIKHPHLLSRLYSEEKLYGRLMENVMASSGLYDLRNYESELLPIYPQKVLDKYTIEIKAAATNVASRNTYREWARTLHHMSSLPGGKDAVNEIVREWREVYRRRKAMMEELNSVDSELKRRMAMNNENHDSSGKTD